MSREGRNPLTPRLNLEDENRKLYLHTLDLERQVKRLEREGSAFREFERHYSELMDSRSFLYFIVDPDGTFLLSNFGTKKFLGCDPERLGAGALVFFCLPDQRVGMRTLLQDAVSERQGVAAIVPLMRKDGDIGWMDVEFQPTVFRGNTAIQVVGADVTDRARLEAAKVEAGAWGQVLDSCPGLLCAVVNREGQLLYASSGYRAVSFRILSHDCVVGRPYPPDFGDMDRTLKNLILAACLGRTNGIELVEHHEDGDRLWNVTVSPLLTGGEEPGGAVIRVLPVRVPTERDEPWDKDKKEEKKPETLPVLRPQLQSEPIPSVRPVTSAEPVPQAFLDAVGTRLVVADSFGVCLAANASFLASLGTDIPAAGGRRLLDLIPKNDPMNEVFHEKLLSVLTARKGELSCRLTTCSGELVWLEVQASPVEWKRARAVLLTFTDVTRLKRTQEQLRRVAVTDRTTGLVNRQGSERILAQEAEKALREKRPLSLIFMDIDGFRRMNEILGYAAADRVLKTLTRAMKRVVREEDLLGRWGGDEFVVLTAQPALTARQLADSLREEAYNVTSDREQPVTFSMGVSELAPEMDVTAFVGSAYDAMTTAKRRGGDCTVLAEENGGRRE